MAVLYRRKEDDSFVILKEINLHELGPSERQVACPKGPSGNNSHLLKMSLNEVRLLSRLDHPHIIAFYDSFEEEGVLMIEVWLLGIQWFRGRDNPLNICRWNMQTAGACHFLSEKFPSSQNVGPIPGAPNGTARGGCRHGHV